MSKLSLLNDLSELTKFVYDITHLKFPKSEMYCLSSQIKRAVISVRLNVREGNAFRGKNKLRFFKIAFGSLAEVEECMLTAKDINFIGNTHLEEFYKLYWLCLNKLRKLINSINSQ